MTTQETPGRSGPGASWYAAAGVVVLVVAGLVYVLTRGGTPSAAPTPTGSTTTATASSSGHSSSPPPSTQPTSQSPVGWPDSGCNGTTGSAGSPVAALAAATWQPFLAAAIPASSELGPKRLSDPLRECFQHSPAGAVMAAANITLAAFTPGTGQRVIESQFVSGPGRDKALSDLASSSGNPANLAAFRLTGCTPEACNVDLIVFGQGLYAENIVPMVWTSGDWKIDGSRLIPEGGIVQGIPAGFTAWGPHP